MKVVELEQGTPEWLAWRRQGFGASDAPLLVHGKHYDRTYEGLIASMITQIDNPIPSNWAMEQGKLFEPQARRWFEETYHVKAPPICCEHEDYPYIRASLDGWVAEKNILLEIKYASKEAHQDALNRKVPSKYVPQLTHQVLASGVSKIYYISGNPRFSADERITSVPFTPGEELLHDMLRRLQISWQAVQNQEPITFAELQRQLGHTK